MSESSQSIDDGSDDWRTTAVETVQERLHRRIDELEREKTVATSDLADKGHDLVDELAATLRELAGSSDEQANDR